MPRNKRRPTRAPRPRQKMNKDGDSPQFPAKRAKGIGAVPILLNYSRIPVPRFMKNSAIANSTMADASMMPKATYTLTSLTPRKP